jgi:HCOMODA/2-hydroxy-3-carboxy-muconic semialdehyde decarboxylase
MAKSSTAARAAKPKPMPKDAIEDLVASYRILAMEGILDAFGHASIRNPDNPETYFISRSRAPELVTPDDILEFDLDSNEVRGDTRKPYLERFIHGQIYKSRPEVNAVIHTHSPSVIPFGITRAKLQPVYHMSSFLHAGVPVFDIHDTAGDTDLLVRDNYLGKALAKSLGKKPLALMRGHGNVVVADNIRIAVYRTIYCEMNARLQMQAMQIGGPVKFLTRGEGRKAEITQFGTIDRPWELWKRKALGK